MKKYFVILKQEEIETCKTPGQVLVYLAIKSFCGNGKTEAALSIRDISKRSKLSVAHIREKIEELEKLGLVLREGTLTRVGGTVEVFRTGTLSVTASNALTKKSVTWREESVTRREESVTDLGTKMHKVKSKKKEIAKHKNKSASELPWHLMDILEKGGK